MKKNEMIKLFDEDDQNMLEKRRKMRCERREREKGKKRRKKIEKRKDTEKIMR